MPYKKTSILFIVSLFATILLSFFIYKELTLLHFINISFVISGTYIFLSLLTMTIKGGFFDAITYGFRRVFVSKGKALSKNEVHEMTPVSDLVDFDHSPMLYSGFLLMVLMVIALFIYYF
ncbi:DUF3899 domain-containing protein [Metabacillus litoralis]|uniref:DUF3899 domain-containing protein n=1 Tax=Metabacillus rhizolycopersici TaxID=2875709 RepID=A0ABS7UVF4_9BACI|nr:DUF3899 domain-containing protein [Metabacillus rhizolycopersici]MBZ5751930.1 DUF3899 domain-containing protein [Metabacillus rhizolycopersici]MCM3651196.1 DUF3899 domain-containing protein [Metabacillus litoralis]